MIGITEVSPVHPAVNTKYKARSHKIPKLFSKNHRRVQVKRRKKKLSFFFHPGSQHPKKCPVPVIFYARSSTDCVLNHDINLLQHWNKELKEVKRLHWAAMYVSTLQLQWWRVGQVSYVWGNADHSRHMIQICTKQSHSVHFTFESAVCGSVCSLNGLTDD